MSKLAGKWLASKLLQLNRSTAAGRAMHYGHLTYVIQLKKYFLWLNEIFDTGCIDIIYGTKIFELKFVYIQQQFLYF
jgi:hypothetical protein